MDTLNTITVIDKYVELCVKRERLKTTIDNAKKGHHYAKTEGEMAFYNGDYKLEKKYNDSAGYYIQTQEKAAKDLAHIEQLLEFTHQVYTKAVQSLDAVELKDLAITVAEKKTDNERQVEKLSQRSEWAVSKGKEAFASKKFEEERKYNSIADDCYREVGKIEPTLDYYGSFINELNIQADKKVERDFGKSDPVVK